MDAEKARSILTQARADGTYEDPIPDEDAKAISEAEDLVQMAETAWKAHTRGPQVESLMRLAYEDFDGGDEIPEKGKPEEEPAPGPEPEPEGDPLDEEVSDIGANDGAYAQVEPWEGYATDKVPDIIEGINVFADQDDDVSELLSHIWAYETAHKSRTRVIKHLEDMAEKIRENSGGETPEDPEPETGGSKAEVEPEPEAPSESEVPDAPVDPVEAPTPDEPLPAPDEAVENQQPDHEEEVTPAGPVPISDETVETIKLLEKIPSHEDRKGSPPEDDSTYQELIEHVEKQLHRERLNVPKAPGEALPEVPWDWTKISNLELHKLYSAYSAAAYYKGYALAREERMARHCKDAADEMSRELLIAMDKYDHKGKEKRVTVLEAEIEADVNVTVWRKRQRKHEIFATAARQERDSYNKLVESFSRLETMRRNEWEKSGK